MNIGDNVIVRENAVIGAHARVVMGSVVTKDVKDGCTVMGNPAK